MSFDMKTLVLLAMAAGRRDGIDPTYAIDAALSVYAHAAGKQVVSLETPELQLAALQMEHPRETIDLVESGLTEIENGHTHLMLKRIARIWSESNYAELARYQQWCECLDTEAERKEMKRLLDKRNPAMAERIEALHGQGQRVFAAVGSLHMFGATGLPALMAQRGYRVERVDFSR